MSTLPLTAYTDSKLQFFYLDQVDRHLTAIKAAHMTITDNLCRTPKVQYIHNN